MKFISHVRIQVAACVIAFALHSECYAGRDTHEGLNSTLWMQTSAEYHALATFCYRNAAHCLDDAIIDTGISAALEQCDGRDYSKLPNAIVMDLDETVLDNSPFQAQCALDRAGYDPKLWAEWVSVAKAKDIPGAKSFIHYAKSRGVTVFFVTNRDVSGKSDTIKNLAALDLIDPTHPEQVLCNGENGWTSDKTSRRQFLSDSYRLLLLVGDDLGDFVSGAKDSPQKRAQIAEANASKWGRTWIIIPNPGYGSWERSLLNFENLPDERQLTTKMKALVGFK